MLFAAADLEQATIDAIHALVHLDQYAAACGEARFQAAVERALNLLVDTVQIDLSRIGDEAESSLPTVRPAR